MLGDEPTRLKHLVWVGPARRELKALPRQVQRTMGVALWSAQNGRIHPAAVPMKGSRFMGVIEVRADLDGSTYRLMYVAKWGQTVYVLGAFQKKATAGIATPRHVLDLIEARGRQARAIHKQHGSHP